MPASHKSYAVWINNICKLHLIFLSCQPTFQSSIADYLYERRNRKVFVTNLIHVDIHAETRLKIYAFMYINIVLANWSVLISPCFGNMKQKHKTSTPSVQGLVSVHLYACTCTTIRMLICSYHMHYLKRGNINTVTICHQVNLDKVSRENY